MSKIKIAFFHGLESQAVSDKTAFLHNNFDDVYAPPMDYQRNAHLFEQVLEEVKKREITLLVGSSMGGWVAYCISTLTGIPALIFNPAVHSRSINLSTQTGSKTAKHTIVLGVNDDVINPEKTVEYFKTSGIGQNKIFYEQNGHRTPVSVFKKWIEYAVNKMHESEMKTFVEWLNETPPIQK